MEFSRYLLDCNSFFLPLILFQNLVIPQFVSPENLTNYKILNTLIEWLVYPFYTGALIVNFSSKINNAKRSITECLLISVNLWPRLFLAVAIVGIIEGIGILFLIIPGIYFFVRLSITDFYVVLEGLKPIDAVKKSYVETKKLQWKIFGITFFLFIPLIIFRFFAYPKTFLLSPDFGILQIATLLIICLINVVFTVVFFRFYNLIEAGDEENPPSLGSKESGREL